MELGKIVTAEAPSAAAPCTWPCRALLADAAECHLDWSAAWAPAHLTFPTNQNESQSMPPTAPKPLLSLMVPRNVISWVYLRNATLDIGPQFRVRGEGAAPHMVDERCRGAR